MDWTTHSVFAQTDHIRYTSRSPVLIICLRKPKIFLETQTDLFLFPGNITLFLFIWIWIRQFQEFKTLQGPESFVMHGGKKKTYISMANWLQTGTATFVAHELPISGSLDAVIFFHLWSTRWRLFKCWLSDHTISKLIRRTFQLRILFNCCQTGIESM